MRARESVRYEKKFFIPSDDVQHVVNWVKTHPALFAEAFPRRVINNVYLDTVDLQNYEAHVAGVAEREKVRIRWYGDLSQQVSTTLEFKVKVGDVGYKRSYTMASPQLQEPLTSDYVRTLLTDSEVSKACGRDLLSLHSVLYNSYRRSYWLSADKAFRLTIDSNIYSGRLSQHGTDEPVRHEGIVLELKYDRSEHMRAGAIGQHFPWRSRRYSKYVAGVDYLRASLGVD